jgi:hypothetical protein
MHAEWRLLTAGDLDAVMELQVEAYPWHQEARAVFEDRIAVYPAGCLALADRVGLMGYAISHPWLAASPPPLDTRLERLPERPGTYYLHDVALARRAHGAGHAGCGVALLAEGAAAAGFRTLSLVAVNGSAPFWGKQGFVSAMTPELAEKLASYGADAIFMTRTLIPEPATDCPPPPN